MKTQAVIVCERRGTWATALSRRLHDAAELRQTRGLDECIRDLDAAPASLLVLELARENLAGVVRLLGQLERRYPMARAIVVAPRELESYEVLMREAGAVHFATSPRDCRGLAEIANRHIPMVAVREPQLAAGLWEALPWGDAK